MLGTVNHLRDGSINKHSDSCPCPRCLNVRIAKRDTGAHEEKMHLAMAHALHHEEKSSKHHRLANYDEGRHLPIETKAKHLEAAAAHGMASDHFRQAAYSYCQGLPKGAGEHEKIAEKAGEHANKLSEKIGQ
jgi:hypothetical protein